MKPPLERFETSRLIVRKPVMTDTRDIFSNYASDPEVTKFLIRHPHADIHETEDYLNFSEGGWSSGKEFTYVIELKENSQVIGALALRPDKFKVML